MILIEQDIDPDCRPLDLAEYARYALKNGSLQEKREIVKVLGEPLYLHNQSVCLMPSKLTEEISKNYKVHNLDGT